MVSFHPFRYPRFGGQIWEEDGAFQTFFFSSVHSEKLPPFLTTFFFALVSASHEFGLHKTVFN